MVNDDNINDHPLKVEKDATEAEKYLAANRRVIENLVSEFLEVVSISGTGATLRLITCINHLNHYVQEWNAKNGIISAQLNADNYGAFSEAVANMLHAKKYKKFTKEGRENYIYCIATLYQLAEELTAYHPKWVSELTFWTHLSNALIMDFQIDQNPASLGMEISCLLPDIQKERKAEVISAYQEVKIKELYHKLLADLWKLRDGMKNNEEQIKFDKEVLLILESMAGIVLSEEERDKPKVKEIYHWLLANLWKLRDEMKSSEEQANFDKEAELILEQMAGIGLSKEEGEPRKAKEMYYRLLTLANSWRHRGGIQNKEEQANFAADWLLKQIPGISFSEAQVNKPSWLRVYESLNMPSLNAYHGVNEVVTHFKLQLIKLTVISQKLPLATKISQEELINTPFVKYWEKFVNWIKGLFDSLFNQKKQKDAVELQTISQAEGNVQITSYKR